MLKYNSVILVQGSHILSKLRPVDQLRQLLIDCQGPDAEEVKAFFRLHKVIDCLCAVLEYYTTFWV